MSGPAPRDATGIAGLEAGFDHHLIKPAELSALLESLCQGTHASNP